MNWSIRNNRRVSFQGKHSGTKTMQIIEDEIKCQEERRKKKKKRRGQFLFFSWISFLSSTSFLFLSTFLPLQFLFVLI
jgi:hypothetical protein